MEIELPSKITDILTIIAMISGGLIFMHNGFKKLHIIINSILEKLVSFEKGLLKLEEKVDSNEEKASVAFEKINNSIMDIKVSNGKLESSFGFLKDDIKCNRLLERDL